MPLSDVGNTGAEIRQLGDEEVRALPAVRQALAEAREQIGRYARALDRRAASELR